MKEFPEIDDKLREWLEAQHLFFVATAPLSAEGRVNCSPKGMDSFRVLGPRRASYLDLTGSGTETIAHLRENARITVMFCAFEGAPRIVRLQGSGTVFEVGTEEFRTRADAFPEIPGARSIIEIEIDRIADSCGWSVPLFDFQGERDGLSKWSEAKGEEGISAYQQERNRTSIDGLPGITER